MNDHQQHFAMATTLVLVGAGLQSALAAPTPGVWAGGTPGTNNPYYICFNVSPDGRRLTASGTQCRGNQGQDQNSIQIDYQAGTTPDGATCNQNSYRNLEFGDIPIVNSGGTDVFDTTFSNSFVTTQIKGFFNPAGNRAAGAVRTRTPFIDCSISWEAGPGTPTPENEIPPASTTPPPGPGKATGITPGRWQGGDPNSENPFFACLNVAPEGNRLTAQNTSCRGNQGQYQNSIDIQFQGGTTPDGQSCNEYSYRNLDYGDISINSDGTFSTNFTNGFVNTTINGKFEGATVSGTVRSVTNWIDCSVDWNAAPATTQ